MLDCVEGPNVGPPDLPVHQPPAPTHPDLPVRDLTMIYPMSRPIPSAVIVTVGMMGPSRRGSRGALH